MQKWKPTHAEKILVSLEADVFPHIGGVHIAEVDAPMLLDVLQKVIDRGAIETARKLNQRIRSILSYAAVRKMVRHNEADNLTGDLPTAERKHNPHLEAKQIPGFIRTIEADEGVGEVLKVAILFSLHTLARTNETRFARWEEFDLEARIWNIPADRMKMGKAHTVPLSNQVMELLERLRPFTGSGAYLFTARSTGRPISVNGMLQVLYRNGLKGTLTIHGLRGTGSTILNEVGFRRDAVEVALSHRDKNAIRAAYNHTDYLDERRIMMQWWSDFIDGAKTGDPPTGWRAISAEGERVKVAYDRNEVSI